MPRRKLLNSHPDLLPAPLTASARTDPKSVIDRMQQLIHECDALVHSAKSEDNIALIGAAIREARATIQAYAEIERAGGNASVSVNIHDISLPSTCPHCGRSLADFMQ